MASVPSESASLFDTVSLPDNADLSTEAHAVGEQLSKSAAVSCGVTLDSIKSLGRIADAEKANVAFIFLAGDDEELARAASIQVQATMDMLLGHGKRVAAFTLRKDSVGYDELLKLFSLKKLPCVIVSGRGCGASAVSGEITEAKLLSAFFRASMPISCGPKGGSCCPK